MPRVILRTVEPAKLFACQSVEKRCTRWNAFAAISLIIFSVSTMMLRNTACRSSVHASPMPISTPNACSARLHAAAVSAAATPCDSASTRRPANSGVSTSPSAVASARVAIPAMRTGCARQCRKVNASTSVNARPPGWVVFWTICRGPAARGGRDLSIVCSKRKPDGRRHASARAAKAKNGPEAVRAGTRPAKTTT
ncbi:hypothetical protein DO70_6534 [Burkholderia pseudomallei]|nr:hypothetical protein DO70_6534 [Burkholderia pseudomallei]